jgi:hypothetical protein
MVRQAKRKSSGPRVLVAALLILAGPVLYAASIGPTARLVIADRLSPKVWRTTYSPIGWAIRHVPGASEAVTVYLEVWGAWPVHSRDNDGSGRVTTWW